MAKNPLIRRKEKSYLTPLPNQSAGILDDHAVRKNIATKEGTIEKVPVNDSDISNKKYVDDKNLWSRTGTTLTPKTSTDSIDLFSGNNVKTTIARLGRDTASHLDISFSDSELWLTHKNDSDEDGAHPFNFDIDTVSVGDDIWRWRSDDVDRMVLNSSTGLDLQALNLTTTGTLEVGAATINGTLLVDQYIAHDGDTDTNIKFINNAIQISVGGVSGLQFSPTAIVLNEGGADVDIKFESAVDVNSLYIVGSTGNVGIGTATPEDILHLKYGSNTDFKEIIIENDGLTTGSSEVDREMGAINFRTNVASRHARIVGYIPAGDAGTDKNALKFIINDGVTERTPLVIRVNGNVGIGTETPTQPLSVKEKAGMSAIGGHMIKLTNKTGSNSVAGQIVKPDTATNDAVILTSADDLEVIGVFLESGVTDGSEAWVVISGIADVAMEDNTAATRGNWVRTSITEAGYCDATNNNAPQPINQTHFAEIGHCIETVTAGGEGTHILARCVLHFN